MTGARAMKNCPDPVITVSILSEMQSIIRERTHQTYSLCKFLVDHPASLLLNLGGVYVLNRVSSKKVV